mgnify:CR=1 FL=1
MSSNKKQKKIRADKTSQKAFKITANVTTSVLQTIGELRAGKDVKVSQCT